MKKKETLTKQKTTEIQTGVPRKLRPVSPDEQAGRGEGAQRAQAWVGGDPADRVGKWWELPGQPE